MKNIRFALFGLFCAISLSVISADKKYPANEIPEELKLGVNAVIRDYSMDLRIISLKKTIVYKRFAVTIFNDAAEDYNTHYAHYDGDSKVNYLHANLYDKFGNLVKKLKKGDIEDQSAVSSISIYEDNRVKIAKLDYSSYPYTVEFEYEIENEGTMFYPGWYPIDDKKVALQHGDYKVHVTSGNSFRYKEFNMQDEVIKNESGGVTSYHWTLNNVANVQTEPMGEKFNELIPKVVIAPNEFYASGYEGRMDSWEEFGLFIKKLNEGRDDLPEATRQKIIEITKDKSNPVEKTKIIYKYLQENTRYVSIQLGIGGFQPFYASFVDEKGYGDCKALSNYTVAMLDAVGIKSHYVLVGAGRRARKLDKEFPNNYFNHAFVCVPIGNDTIWLECTSQTNPFGYLGTFTGGREVMLVTDDGGEIVKTPSYSAEDNKQITKARIKIDEEGNALVDAKIRYTGIQSENNGMNFYVNYNHEDQKKWLYQHLDISGVTIDNFELKMDGDFIPVATKNLELTVPKYATINGKRLFLPINMLSKHDYYPSKDEHRKSPIYFKTGTLDEDDVVFEMPPGYHLEYHPQPIHLTNDFGEYKLSVEVDETKVTFKRTLKITAGEYPASSYDEVREFFKTVTKSDKTKIVFVNAT